MPIKAGSGKDSGFKKFIKENKSLAFMLPLLAVLIIVVVIIYVGGGKEKSTSVNNNPTPAPSVSATSTPTSDQQKVEVLPQTERTNDQQDQGTQNGQTDQNGQAAQNQESTSIQDPFKTPMKLTGVLLYSNNDSTAIIEYGGVSYIVSKDGTIGDTNWKVAAIDEKSAILESGEKSVKLDLNMEHSVPVDTSKNDSSSKNVTVTIKVQNADLRDILSAIALNMKCSVIFTGEASRINLDEINFTPEDALSTLLKTVEMDYFRNGNTIIVGTKDKLSKDFMNNMVLTKFSLRYVTSDIISSQIDSLGLTVQKFTLDTNKHAIWVQGFPQDLGKVGELISMLDRPENMQQSQSTTVLPYKFTPIVLTYITADQMNSVLTEAGFPAGLILDTNPKTLYVYANANDLKVINELKSKIDVTANQQGSGSTIIVKKLTYIKSSEVLPIISQFGMDVKVITLDRVAMTIWLMGDVQTINQVSAMVDKIDIPLSIDDKRFIIRKLTNITAAEADSRLKLLNIPGITTYTFSYPQFTKSILVVCPQDYQLYITGYLSELDVATDKIKIPIDFSDEPSGSSLLAARRDLIVSLTGIPATSFTISNNVSRTATPHYVLILEETQEKIKMVQDLITQIDSPVSSGGGSSGSSSGSSGSGG